MFKINPNNYEIELSYGDDIPLTFTFKENNAYKRLNENVVFTLKQFPGDGYPELIKKTYRCNNSYEALFSITSSDLLSAGIKVGAYYYDLYLETSKQTVIPPTLFVFKEVAHDVD